MRKPSGFKLELVLEDGLDDGSEKAPPLYTTSQSIRGTLKIRGNLDQEFVVKVTFNGIMFNRISFPSRNYYQPPDLAINQKTYECVMVHQSSSSSIFRTEEPNCRTIDICLPLDRRFLRSVDDSLETNDTFPPSMQVNALKSGERGAYCRVSYEVKASLSCSGMETIKTKKEVRVIDEAMAPSPPICVSHFGSEYVCNRTRSLKNRLGMQQGRLSVFIAEPSPVELTQRNDHDMTQMLVKFKLDDITPASVQKDWTASVDWCLKASTFISSAAMKSAPTCELADKSLFLRHAATNISSGQRKMVLAGWQKKDDGSSTWTLETPLLLSLVPKVLPAPTFSSAFVARRYFVSIQMRVAGEGSASFDLRVPVQLTFSANGPALSRRGSHDSFCTLPEYVR